MNTILEKKIIRVSLYLIFIALGCIAAFYTLSYLLYWLAPFITAYLLSLIAEPIIRFLTTHFKLKRKLAAGIAVGILVLTFGTLHFFIGNRIWKELQAFLEFIPQFKVMLNRMLVEGRTLYAQLPPEVLKPI
ncbi:MAG: AI-2E family transporter, partial [Hyphomonadaceae bacterium]|nr:AI-2E family transporter [Clostridia bacterium]